MPAYRGDDGAGLRDTVTALQRQTVLWFADDAERAAALAAPRRGLLTFVDNRSAFEWWTGTGWQALAGDMSSITTRLDNLETAVTALGTRVTNLETRMTAVEGRPAAPVWNGGVAQVTAGAEGFAGIAHGLGVVPSTVVAVVEYKALGGGAITDVCDIEPFPNASTFGVRLANNHGDFLPNGTTAAVWWLAMAGG